MSQVTFETMTALMSIFLLGDLTAKILKLEMYSVGLSCDMPSMLETSMFCLACGRQRCSETNKADDALS